MDAGNTADAVTLADITAARGVAGAVAKHTPVVSSVTLSNDLGQPVVLKAESLQRTGSFKIRGAMNKVASLGSLAKAGVTAGSAGNHAQALAFAAKYFGVPCDIFVPAGAPISKIEACRGYGATVIETGSSVADAIAAARDLAERDGKGFCHPYDDPAIIAGQGTLGLEIVEDLDDLTCVVLPIGGGGLAGGVAIAVKSLMPDVRVVGVQAAVCSPFAGGPVTAGAVTTLADGIAVKHPGDLTRPLIEAWVDDIVTVDEDAIADAMVLLMDRSKLYVEGAGAVGVAALQSGAVRLAGGGHTCVVLSGGNVDLGVVPGLIRRHETTAGRRLVVFTKIDDRPGGLVKFLSVFADNGANLIDVEHHREGVNLSVRQTGVHATFEVRDPDHAVTVAEAARHAGFEVELEK